MDKSVYLMRPSQKWQQEYLSYYQEWIDSDEKMVPWVVERDPGDFQGMLQFLEDLEVGELPEGWVPSTTYWLVHEEGTVLGVVNLRHALNPKLLSIGGNIGYGIRPSERRKGYATLLLALALKNAAELGLEKVLVVCDESNVGSERTIRKNGGVQDVSYVEEDGNVILRFWIDLKAVSC